MSGSKLITCRFLRAKNAIFKLGNIPFHFSARVRSSFWLDNINRGFFVFEPLRASSGIDTKIDQKKYLFPRLIFNKLTSVFYASVLLLMMNFVKTLSKCCRFTSRRRVDLQPKFDNCCDLFIVSVNKFIISGPISDANEGTSRDSNAWFSKWLENPLRGRFTSETQHERRLEIQRKRRRRKMSTTRKHG